MSACARLLPATPASERVPPLPDGVAGSGPVTAGDPVTVFGPGVPLRWRLA